MMILISQSRTNYSSIAKICDAAIRSTQFLYNENISRQDNVFRFFFVARTR